MPRPEVFLSHASADKEGVKAIALQLQQRAVPTWLDEWNLIPGEPWVDGLGQALQECSGCVVFLGPSGAAPWHHEEVRSALDRAVRDRTFRVVPVLLPGTKREKLSHLPAFLSNRHWVDFAKGLDDPDALHRLVCGIQGKEPGAPGSATYQPGRNPYRGLRVFDVGDAPLFFGREVLTQELLAKLGAESRFVSVVGPSGSGKSSLVRAGLLASLRAGGLPGSAEWPQVIIRPGAFPLEALALGIGGKLAAGIDPSELVRRFGAGEEALHRQVGMALQGRAELRAVLLIDQAEEVFTQGAGDAERAAFFGNLVYAATVRTGQTVVLLSFRSDFYSRFAEHQQLAALVSENQLLVSPMSGDQLREVIALPAERAGRPLRPALVDELLRDAQGRPGSLPLLEHALAQLWERPEPVLGIEEYRAIGGLAGAIDSRAEEVFGKLTADQQAACRRLFLRLIQTAGTDALDTRRRVRADELPADQREVSQAFAAEGVHLLTWAREGAHDVVEVAHEELIRQWARLQRWADEDRLGQRTHRRLTAAVDEWTARAPEGRDDSFLYRGAALAEVEEWLARLPDDERSNVLNASESAFLEQSRTARDRARLEEELAALVREEAALALARKTEALRAAEEQRRNEAEASERRVRSRFTLAVVMGLLAAGTATVAVVNARTARRERAVALSRELTAVVTANLHDDPQLNLALLKEAHRLAETDELFAALVKWARAGRMALRGHDGRVWSAAFSPDGTRIATGSEDGTARIWDAASGRCLAILSGHSDAVYNAAFSPDGARLLTVGDEGKARIWDASSGTLLITLTGHFGLVYGAAFSPDGHRVLTAGEDGTAQLWDASSGKPMTVLTGHTGEVYGAAFSRDGSRIVTAGHDRTARIWDATSGKLIITLSGHTYEVLSAAFSPDGSRIVTASFDHSARLWDAASGKPLAVLSGHSGTVVNASFSPDGSRIVTGSFDKTARLWDASSGAPYALLSGDPGTARNMAFSSDGSRVFTMRTDGTEREWDVFSGKLLSASGQEPRAAFEPDVRRTFDISSDHTARIQDASSGKLLFTFPGHARGAVISPDGLRVATLDEDGTVLLWRDLAWAPRAKQLEVLESGRELTPDERRIYLHE